MIFDDIHVDSLNINGVLYVNVEQLNTHLIGSANQFAEEAYELAQISGITKKEKYLVMGMVQGMMSVASILGIAQEESVFSEVETVDDLLQRFKENDES
jgi:hypothetical protein